MTLQGLYLDKNIPTPFTYQKTMEYFKKGTPEAKEEIIKHNLHMIINIIESKYSKSPYKE